MAAASRTRTLTQDLEPAHERATAQCEELSESLRTVPDLFTQAQAFIRRGNEGSIDRDLYCLVDELSKINGHMRQMETSINKLMSQLYRRCFFPHIASSIFSRAEALRKDETIRITAENESRIGKLQRDTEELLTVIGKCSVPSDESYQYLVALNDELLAILYPT